MTTPALGMTEMAAKQAQPELIFNPALRTLEQGATFFNVKSATTTAQPGSPADGDAYIVPVAATGAAWAGKDKKIAFYMSGWIFLTARTGWKAFVVDVLKDFAFDGTNWGSYTTRYDLDTNMFGLQTVASQLVRRFQPGRAVTFATTGHVAGAGTAATASTVFTIFKNGSSVGTITFAASGTSGTFSIASPISLNGSTDVLTIKGPATADATLADVSIWMAGIG